MRLTVNFNNVLFDFDDLYVKLGYSGVKDAKNSFFQIRIDQITRVSGWKHVLLIKELRFHLLDINHVVQFNSPLLLSPHSTL